MGGLGGEWWLFLPADRKPRGAQVVVPKVSALVSPSVPRLQPPAGGSGHIDFRQMLPRKALVLESRPFAGAVQKLSDLQ